VKLCMWLVFVVCLTSSWAPAQTGAEADTKSKIGHGVNARGTGEVPGAALGRQDSPAHREGSVKYRGSDLRIVGWIVGWKFRPEAAKFFEMWWPGTELNRRRQPFQGLLPSWRVAWNQQMSLSVMSLCERPSGTVWYRLGGFRLLDVRVQFARCHTRPLAPVSGQFPVSPTCQSSVEQIGFRERGRTLRVSCS